MKTGADEKPLAQAIVNDGLEQMAALHDRLSRFKAQDLLSIVLQHSRTLRGLPPREAIRKESEMRYRVLKNWREHCAVEQRLNSASKN